MDIFKDIQAEIEFFFDDLNWTYILIYAFVLYGIKYKEEFIWYNNLFDKKENIKPFKIWVAGIIVIIIFSIFKGLEYQFTSTYLSQLLRSWILVIVFNSALSKKIKDIDK